MTKLKMRCICRLLTHKILIDIFLWIEKENILIIVVTHTVTMSTEGATAL